MVLATRPPLHRSGPPQTVEEAIDGWLRSCRRNGVQGGTLKKYERTVLALGKDWPVTEETINDWRDTLVELRPGTQRLYLTIMRSYLHWCVEQNCLVENPLLGVRMPKKPKPRPWERTATEGEITALLRACRMSDWWDHRLATMIRVAANTGLRAMELCNLRWRDVAWNTPQSGVAQLDLTSTKDDPLGERAYVTARAFEYLRHWATRQNALGFGGDDVPVFPSALVNFNRDKPLLTGKPMHPSRFHGDLARLSRRAKLDRIVFPHALRHAAGTELYRRTGDIESVRRFLRHEGYEMTKAYMDTVQADQHMLGQLQRAKLGDRHGNG